MKCAVAALAVVVVAAAATLGEARPDTVFNYEGEDHKHYQKGDTGRKVEGYYSWISPEGQEFYVKYVADELGYRVLESNALPVSSWGATPDGHQGNLDPYYGEAQVASH
ncbi:larval cuticle protein III/IV-like [Portunus trituberculatus]|uniref:larval cuticle protein III/IV-like n=1 Tax=Portunus trituberculatus TaxID=210409 RepID=UPI001E1CD5C2|nr:larval cuticle protein III/IV-like [Portunus trituberculatus]